MIEKTYKYDSTPGDKLMAYDKNSIMHYGGTLRGRFSSPIITDKITGKSIGVNREMSPLDIEKLNQMYPCAKTPPTTSQQTPLIIYITAPSCGKL